MTIDFPAARPRAGDLMSLGYSTDATSDRPDGGGVDRSRDLICNGHLGAPDRIDAAVRRQVLRSPEAPAVVWKGRSLSYGELELRSNRLAHYLRRHGVGPDVRVAVMLQRSPSLIVALLAILKAGGAYVPLDPRYPADRLSFMLADSAASLLLVDTPQADFSFAGRVVDMRDEAVLTQSCPAQPPSQQGDGRDLAYIIYTSGSTGVPKGVMLAHSILGFIQWCAQTLMPDATARVAATSSVCFDPSVTEIFLPLCTGGCVVLKEDLLDPFTHDEAPTLLQGVPSALRELARAGAVPSSVRVLNVGGEPLSADVARELYSSTQIERLFNHYGPTEASTAATVALVDRDCWETPTIGYPVAGARIHLLTPDGIPICDEEVGEIYIGGPGVACGYWDRPHLNEERFLPDPFSGDAGARLYRTGDLARRLPNGAMEFMGRIEAQVKIRGHRVEPGEIELTLRRIAGVEEAAVVAHETPSGQSQLVAFVSGPPASEMPAVRAALARWLPSAMRPSRIVRVERFPRTLSGKIDYKALPGLIPQRSKTRTASARSGAAPAEDALETTITGIFRSLLDHPDVGPNDDFFDLGGDSLLAYRLAIEIEAAIDRPVSPVIVGQASTPRALAELIEAITEITNEHICMLSKGGGRKPIFCLPDVDGQSANFVTFAKLLEKDRPVYGLIPTLPAGASTGEVGVSDLTANYLAVLRAQQPHGPYCIAGYSFGGIAAFDLARRLETEGEEVTLILIDALVGRSCFRLPVLLRWFWRHGIAYLAQTGLRKAIETARGSRWTRWSASKDPAPAWVSERSKALAQAMIKATRRYRVTSFGGNAILLSARDRGPLGHLLDHDGQQGWRGALTGRVLIATLATGHMELMRAPWVNELVAVLQAYLGDGGGIV